MPPTVCKAESSPNEIRRREYSTIAFWSRKFNPAELNFEIYDKEMLAIVDTMEHYRHYFEGLGQQTIIFSDHKNLLWFTETKIYNRRQARWAEKLSRFCHSSEATGRTKVAGDSRRWRTKDLVRLTSCKLNYQVCVTGF